MLVDKKLDTVVSEADIEKFIRANASVDKDKETIRFIILNMRKRELIEKTTNNLYKQAVRDRIFEIY